MIVDTTQTRKHKKQWNQPVGTGFITHVHFHIIKLSEARFDTPTWYKIHLPYLNYKRFYKSGRKVITNYFNGEPLFDHFFHDEWKQY